MPIARGFEFVTSGASALTQLIFWFKTFRYGAVEFQFRAAWETGFVMYGSVSFLGAHVGELAEARALALGLLKADAVFGGAVSYRIEGGARIYPHTAFSSAVDARNAS